MAPQSCMPKLVIWHARFNQFSSWRTPCFVLTTFHRVIDSPLFPRSSLWCSLTPRTVLHWNGTLQRRWPEEWKAKRKEAKWFSEAWKLSISLIPGENYSTSRYTNLEILNLPLSEKWSTVNVSTRYSCISMQCWKILLSRQILNTKRTKEKLPPHTWSELYACSNCWRGFHCDHQS